MAKRKNTRPKQSKEAQQPPVIQMDYRSQIKQRFWMLLNYLTIPLVSALVFGFTAACEYFLFQAVWSFLATDIQNNSAIRQIAEWVQIAIFVITMVGAIVHAGFSLYATIQIEHQLARSDN